MKRQTQQTGVRKYFGGDLIALQAEPLKALDAFFAEYGACVIEGCALEALGGGRYNVGAGLVALSVTDLAIDERQLMVMPFAGVQNVVLPLYLVASADIEQRVYGDGRVKPIAYNYTATASAIKPDQGVDHLAITASGCVRFVDVLQDAAHRFVTDAEKTAWSAKAAANHNHDDKYNNYTHPADASTRHVSDAEKTAWNAKASGTHNHDDKYNNYTHPDDTNTRHVTDAEKTAWNAKASGSHTHNYAPTTHTHNELVSTDGSIAVSKSGITLPSNARIDMPGVLCAGRVSKLGSIVPFGQWGCKECRSAKVDNQAGIYKITHNLQHTYYYVTATPANSEPWTNARLVIKEKTTTYVIVVAYEINSADVTVNTDFDFMICGRN